MTKDKALKLALEALETVVVDVKTTPTAYEAHRQAIAAIKEALAQPEQEPVAWLDEEKKVIYWHNTHETDDYHGFKRTRPLYKHPPVLASTAKPVLEIVNGQINRSWDAIPDGFIGTLYTTPPKREWVGLTKGEIDSWDLPKKPTVSEFVFFVETKLKEKNT